MYLFFLPNVDPIPLPAPVWLFKVLHIVTLMLHFVAVQLILGGLTIGTLWNFFGKEDSPMREASNSIVKKLPTVMTYVINFGVPPLLFAQVLYGQALYTSSVVIGAYWIAVIFLLIAGYYLLYRAADRANENKSWWWLGIISLILLAYVARIYSTNMTLMLRPEEWLSLYQQSSGAGTIMPKGDPTTLPRFLFMTVGSLGLAGISTTLLGLFFNHTEKVKDYMVRVGAALATVFLVLQMLFGYWVYAAQPEIVKEGLMNSPVGFYGMIIWGIFSVAALLTSVLTFVSRSAAKITASVAGLSGILMTAGAVLARDAIRDLSLLAKNFDVWNRNVVANWSVVSIFLVLFVAALILIAFLLIAVNRSMKEVKQNA
ncbi:MAG: hypothetical protein K1X72_29245 [Pyrinomonadaceae bacterium]|nr:hypothetical protein [Pyrinomonadaceae bacterium]